MFNLILVRVDGVESRHDASHRVTQSAELLHRCLWETQCAQLAPLESGATCTTACRLKS